MSKFLEVLMKFWIKFPMGNMGGIFFMGFGLSYLKPTVKWYDLRTYLRHQLDNSWDMRYVWEKMLLISIVKIERYSGYL